MKTVAFICVVVLVGFVMGLGYCHGLSKGYDEGYDAGLGRAKYYITEREMKSFANGYRNGFWTGRETNAKPIERYMKP